MARPAILCHLQKGKMIDAQVGFVDTFNWMVDYINNLRGDEDNIEIRNPTGINPVVQFVGEIPEAEGGGGSVDLTTVDVESGAETTVEGVKTLRIESGTGSHITFYLTDDGEGNATLTVGVQYDDSSSSSNSSSGS